jgi:hypothetical protein
MFPSKRRLVLTGLYGVSSQKVEVFTFFHTRDNIKNYYYVVFPSSFLSEYFQVHKMQGCPCA